MAPVRHAGFAEGSCFGQTCVFGQFCSNSSLYEECRDCQDLLPWCKKNQTEFQWSFPSCGYICREQELLEALRNAQRRQDGGFDNNLIILGTVCGVLLMLLFGILARKSWKLRLALAGRCRKENPAASPETVGMISSSRQNADTDSATGTPSDQDPESSPASCDSASSNDNSQLMQETNRASPEPSAPTMNQIDETLQGFPNSIVTASSVPSETRNIQTALPHSARDVKYPTPEGRSVSADLHIGGAQNPSSWLD